MLIRTSLRAERISARNASGVWLRVPSSRTGESVCTRLVPTTSRPGSACSSAGQAARPASSSRTATLRAGRAAWPAELQALPGRLVVGTSRVHTDSPVRDEATRNHTPEAFRALMRSARSEVLISNAYVIPDDHFMQDLRELAARGVRVRILTNSLASHDVPAVNAHYEAFRLPILKTGAELHEFRSDAAIRGELVDTAPVRSGFVGLHIKAMVIDRQRSFIGSMNLDPRSEVFNSEMGVVIDSAPLAEALARGIERDLGPDNSWRVQLAADGSLRWSSAAGERGSAPARSVWQRVESFFFKLAPSSLY